LTRASPDAAKQGAADKRRLPLFHDSALRLTVEANLGRYPNCRPRDAATLIVLDHSGAAPKFLMGKRHHGHKFMPGKYVFPGGRVEPQDYMAPHGGDLPAGVESKLLRLLKGIAHPRRAYALALAALRETREETGLVIATPFADDARGVPKLGAISFVARAITPPGRARRFDTRFFVVAAEQITARLDIVDGEFSAIDWVTLQEARGIDLPIITRTIIDDLQHRFEAGQIADHAGPVPFYFKRGACFHRKLL